MQIDMEAAAKEYHEWLVERMRQIAFHWMGSGVSLKSYGCRKALLPFQAMLEQHRAAGVRQYENTGMRPYVCHSGCSWCCYQTVYCLGSEAIAIAESGNHDVDSTCQSKKHAIKQVGRERARVPCALLVDNQCSAYDLRPFVCRGYYSSDVSKCESSYYDPDRTVNFWIPPYAMSGMLSALLLVLLRREGVPENQYEMNAAIRCVQETPRAEERFLSGEDIFSTVPKWAQISEGGRDAISTVDSWVSQWMAGAADSHAKDYGDER